MQTIPCTAFSAYSMTVGSSTKLYDYALCSKKVVLGMLGAKTTFEGHDVSQRGDSNARTLLFMPPAQLISTTPATAESDASAAACRTVMTVSGERMGSVYNCQ